jgi:CHAT domain-containing protein
LWTWGKGRILFLSGPFEGIIPPYEPEEFTDLHKAQRKEDMGPISMMEEWHPVIDIDVFNTSFLDGTVAFLNACETGQHKYAGGGHFQGLSSVLLRNGAHSVISSLCPIVDHTSRDFAIHFYKELLQTHSVGISLQKARFHIKNKYGPHIYWIPYIHYGSPI